jgi:hypothetical protein
LATEILSPACAAPQKPTTSAATDAKIAFISSSRLLERS